MKKNDSTGDETCLSDEAQRLYDMYDLFISGDFNGQPVWYLLAEAEERYAVDDIQMEDGTCLWNLLRVFFYTFHHEHTGKRNLKKLSFIRNMSVVSLYHQVFHRYVPVVGDRVLRDVVCFMSRNTRVNEACILSGAYKYITVFSDMKRCYKKQFLKKGVQQCVLSCGYGRLPMAKAQACRELGIPCVEEQHGVITRYLVAYRRAGSAGNYDCVPGFFSAYDEFSAGLVKDGGLFAPENVSVKGHPRVKRQVLFTGQWIVVDETRVFLSMVADLLPSDVVLLFKPHPFDVSDYSDLMEKGVVVLERDEADVGVFLRSVDVHATVYSSCGLDALYWGVPVVFVDVCHLVKPGGCVVDTPQGFVERVLVLVGGV